jgi:type II restriction enzyme
MKFKDFVELWERYKQKYGDEAYRHISELLREAKEIHRRIFVKTNPDGDFDQSWRTVKGHNLEKLINYIIKDEIEDMGLRCVMGINLESNQNLYVELSKVKRNVLVDYGEYGEHLPDVDIIVYKPNTSEVVAIISSKVTLRERIAETGYWKIKLANDEATKHIKVYFVTPDEDGTLTTEHPTKKGRAIAEVDTDGTFVMTEAEIQESDKVKLFDKFIDELRGLINVKS